MTFEYIRKWMKVTRRNWEIKHLYYITKSKDKNTSFRKSTYIFGMTIKSRERYTRR